jgi:hypothetical protein
VDLRTDTRLTVEIPRGHIDEALVLDVVDRLLADEGALRRLAIARMRWLTFGDVMEITGFSRRKLEALVAAQTIPMFRAPDSSEWRITQDAWTKTERRLVADGLLPRNRCR